MSLELHNATLTTQRDGTDGNVLTAVCAQVEPAKLQFTPMGPQRSQMILLDPHQDVLPSDYLFITFVSGLTRKGTVTFADEIEDEDDELSYMQVTVIGELLPA